MALQRQTVGAQAVVHSHSIAIGQKLTKMLAADGAFHLVAPIERSDQEAEHIAQFNEPLAGKNLGEKGNQFLHLRLSRLIAQKYTKNPYLCKK